MNSLIQGFVDEYIVELQNIPYYSRDIVDGVTKRQVLSWFDEEKLEHIFEVSKNKIAKILTEKNVGWVLEKCQFADDIERAILFEMACNSLWSVIDPALREKYIKKEPRLDGLVDDSMALSLNNAYETCNTELKGLLDSIVEAAEKSPAKPKTSQTA